ncbi:siderophore-interacting protein [Psychrosphaera sp. B3R10]|uniref:siderophore-interacting protein n=1 Tax=unclassified Psychrosphaera TaxID=2641570 RepID=UPI001C0997B6|nr:MULTISPECIES: siderophore-interacting protein [unclassified Psychrosphaera]MBU2880423.1 siderophore-interacting protein [Psychrosphaera sp. I2R16]MBU2987862.1 siderophore-interacting protein [Psychrosphaera sp. B3R10]
MGPKMRMTEVLSVSQLSPHMKRIVLTGDALADFPEGKESAHVKAIFPDPNSGTNKPRLGMYIGFKKWMRSYTIRSFDKVSRSLTIDFAVNDHQGLASNWALNAKVGDFLGIAGPGDIKHADLAAQQHLFFGDITALPAIAATLEMLPKNATGHAYIQVPEQADIQQFSAPPRIDIHWLVTANKLTDEFLTGLKLCGKNLRETAIFIAAEASVVKQLKGHLNSHCQYDKSKLYASAYWNQKR